MAEPGSGVSERWVKWRRAVDLDAYDSRWEDMAARGESVHGEMDFVEGLFPGRELRILDAGCGTGRLAIEAARRGHRCVGVDLDSDMIDRARAKAEFIDWIVADLSKLKLGEHFDVVVMAGNIPLYCRPGSQASIVSVLAQHLVLGGALFCGFSIETGGGAYTADDIVRDAEMAGFVRVDRFANWNGEPFDSGETNDYVVAVCWK